LLCLGCPRTTEEAQTDVPPSAEVLSPVVLITLEQVRPDRLEAFGGPIPSPAIAALASEGVVFEDASTPVPLARPALASLFLGLAPDRTDVRDEESDRVTPGSRTLASVFSETGFETAAFVSSPLASYSSGLDAGFAIFDGPEDLVVGPARNFTPVRPASEVVSNFEKWLESVPYGKGFFAWVHLADARGLSATLAENADANSYDAALGAVDAAIGRIRESLAKRAGPVEIVVAGTQGAMLGEDGAFGDAFWLREETLHVPLVWSGGRASEPARKGTRDRRRVDLLDVGATVAPGRIEGADGANLFGVGTFPGNRPRRAWTWSTDDRFGWPTLSAVDEGSGWEVSEGLTGTRPAFPRERLLDDDLRQRLEAAGLKVGKGIDLPATLPSDANEQIRAVQLIEKHLADGRPRMAWGALRESTKIWPDSLALATHRLFVAALMAKPDWISEALAETIDRFPGRPEILHWAAHCAFALKDYPKAEALVEAAVSMGVGDADLYYDLACTRSLAGDHAASLEWLSKSIAAGYRNWDWMERDPDLVGVRSHPGYAKLLQETTR
jgi:hypothetical protein